MRPTDWNAKLQYTDSSGTPSGTDALVREVLTADRTYYVRTDGSDSNTGLANTSGGAFLTIQKAIDVIKALDFNDNTITIQVGNGTYTGSIVVAGMVGQTITQTPKLYLRGDPTTPSNVVISVTGSNCLFAQRQAQIWVEGFRFQTTTSGTAIFVASGGNVFMSKCDFGSLQGHGLWATGNGTIDIIGDYSISGGSACHWVVNDGGRIFSFPDDAGSSPYGTATITLTSTPAFSTAFAQADAVGSIAIAAYGPVTFSGTASGKRYDVLNNAVINTFGAGATYLPGTVAGTTSTGGVYA